MPKTKQSKAPIVTLSPEDGEVLDALMQSLTVTEHEGRGGVAGDPRRAERIGSLLALLDRCPADDPPTDLTQRTLDHIKASKQRQRFSDQVHALTAPVPTFRWTELITVAAVMMIAMSLLWPFLAQSRTEARRVACASGLASAGLAFGRYAADEGGVLPRRGSFPGSFWHHVGEKPQPNGPVRSNSAHLAMLINARYIHPNTLACPQNRKTPLNLPVQMHDWPNPQAVPYSYQNQFTSKVIRIDGKPGRAIVADRNPFLEIRRDGRSLRIAYDPNSSGHIHGRIGQNVLLGNGAVQWTEQPQVDDGDGDNFYLIDRVERYEGNEVPASEGDSFLNPP